MSSSQQVRTALLMRSVHPLAGQFGKLTQWDQVAAFFTFLSQQLGRVQYDGIVQSPC